MNMDDSYELAEDQLIDDLNDGRITRAEFNDEIRHMDHERRMLAEEAAQDAYDEAMGCW